MWLAPTEGLTRTRAHPGSLAAVPGDGAGTPAVRPGEADAAIKY